MDRGRLAALADSAPCTERVLLVIIIPEVTWCALELTFHYKIPTTDVFEAMPMTGPKMRSRKHTGWPVYLLIAH